MKFNKKIKYKPEQQTYDIKMEKSHSWWWLLLLLLIPLILWLLSRCDGIIPKVIIPSEDDTTRVAIDSTVFTHPVQVMLSWYNTDDLDLHVTEPNGFEIYYSRSTDDQTLGHLNFDMNVGYITSTPKEHISWPLLEKMIPSEYEVSVVNYRNRENVHENYQIDITDGDHIYSFAIGDAIQERKTVKVLKFNWTAEDGVSIIQSIVPAQETNRSTPE